MSRTTQWTLALGLLAIAIGAVLALSTGTPSMEVQLP